jgi:THO complex subunit 5
VTAGYLKMIHTQQVRSSSIYQDVPLYSPDQFKELAPPEAVVDDEHQLMLNRLSFELAERQR